MKYYTVDAVARILGIPKDEVKSLTRSGVIKQGYIEDRQLYLLDVAAREIIGEMRTPEAERKHVDYNTERAKLMQVKRKSEEYDLLVKQGQLFGKEEIQLAMSKMLVAFKARLTAIPNRAAPQVAKMRNQADIMELLTYLIDEALNELSDADKIFNNGDGDGAET